MKNFCRLLVFVIGSFASQASVRADIMMRIEPGVFELGSNSQSLNVFARSNASDTLVGLVVDFDLPGGGRFNATPGSFAQLGMIGFGNSAVSSFTRDSSILRNASLSLDFAAPQLFPANDQLLATLSIDVTGLEAGMYPATMLVEASNGVPPFGDIIEVPTNGSFTLVTAVPEPSSLVLLGASALIVMRRRRVNRHLAIAGK